MNQQRRHTVHRICADLCEIASRLEAVLDDEREYLDNMPEGIRDGERGERAEETISTLEDALAEIETLESGIAEAVDA